MITAFLAAQVPAVSVAVGIVALAILVLSSNLAVKKLVGVAMYFKLSVTFMGMTIFSLATSIPEITSHLVASIGILRGTMDYKIGSAIVLGANIGSDVVQQTLIMGIVVAFTGVLYFRRYFLWKSMIPMIGTTVMCLILGWDRSYSRLDGLILFGTFIAYTYYLYRDERKHYQKTEEEEHHDVPENMRQVIRDSLIACGAMVFTIGGAQLVLSITEMIVQMTGVGGSLIGVVTLGVASALPELTTALSGIKYKAHGVSIGTLVGSNITNPLVAIGGGALVSTYWVPQPLLHWDLPWETITGMILWAILWFSKGKLGKWGAVYLIGLYVLYVTLRMLFFAVD